MVYSIILAIHIIVAGVTGVVAVYSLYALLRNIQASYRACAISLGFVSAFEVVTGTALAALSPDLSATALSIHIALYLGACLIVELLLFSRMRKNFLAFPVALAGSPVLASLFLFLAAISYGF